MTLAPLLLNSLQLFKSLQWNSAKTQNQLTHVTIRSHLVVSFRQPFNMNHFLTTFNIKKSISTESKDYRSEHHKGFFCFSTEQRTQSFTSSPSMANMKW